MKADDFRSLEDTFSTMVGWKNNTPPAFDSKIVATKVLQDNVHKRLERNTYTIATVVLSGIQQLKLEVAKACCMDYQILNNIFYDGISRGVSPFCNRPLRRIEDQNINENVLFEVDGAYPLRWNITWQHNQTLPSFITYSVNSFISNGTLVRFADIDEEHLVHYMSENDLRKFNFYLDEIKKANLTNRLLDKQFVGDLRGIVCDAGEEVKKQLGCDVVLYSGGGFRPLMKADKDRFTELVAANMLCDSSSVNYQPQKLFSAQLSKPHLQTDVHSNSKMFDYSNPAFFMLRKDDVFATMCHDFYDACLPSNFEADGSSDAEIAVNRFTGLMESQAEYVGVIQEYMRSMM